MGRFDRAAGLARSLVIYHAIPRRQRRLRRLYSQFVGRDDLVFDVGAHAGNRVRAFAALGCRVVALEPQPDFARVLRTLFSKPPRITVVEAAVGASPGRLALSISDRTPTVTTLSDEWRGARAQDPDFAHVRWNRRIEVEMTTLDLLIAQFGAPAFIKIDVEGSEPAVLVGLTHAVRALSFEYLPRALDQVQACLTRLTALGDYRFNWSPGESYALAEPSWLTERQLLSQLGSPEGRRRASDVYARLSPGPPRA